jgi:hypothetical protein
MEFSILFLVVITRVVVEISTLFFVVTDHNILGCPGTWRELRKPMTRVKVNDAHTSSEVTRGNLLQWAKSHKRGSIWGN